ncbi:uroporphyrinogen-III synthase [Rhodocista pekingensis]|uniref:Uroporphyrinogen-III synthase n=1 Tax=Rhodocista pekingensis TaxID=201185 RepID=A0ABW2KUU4_9PROT
MTGILVTRPQPEADQTAAELAARGFTTLIEPLLEVRLLPGPALDLAGVQALLLTSINGVRATLARTDRRDLPVLAVGRRTGDEARAAGFAEVREAEGDAVHLAALIRREVDPAAGRLLHVSGVDLAADLAELLGPDGYTVDRIVGYEAVAAEHLSPEVVSALRQADISIALFFSPRTARTFVRLATAAGLADRCAGMSAFCLSPAVASAAAGLPWQAVRVAERPAAGALLDLLPPAGTAG